MAKKVDPKAKAKRQKIIAAVGGVLLLGLLAFQVPKTMKLLNQKAPEPVPVAAPTTVPSDPSVLPTPRTVGGSGGGAAPGAAGGGVLIDTDASPVATTGQLVAFGRFASKDPFQQQIDETKSQSDGGSSAGGSSAPVPSAPKPDTSAEPGDGVVTPAKPGQAPPAAVPTSAVIAVNGAPEPVAVKGDFPKESPVFTLVALTKDGAKVAIAGGAFASGAPTITLKLGKTITLVNTADGARYELKLVSLG